MFAPECKLSHGFKKYFTISAPYFRIYNTASCHVCRGKWDFPKNIINVLASINLFRKCYRYHKIKR